MASILTGESIVLNKVLVGTWVGDGSYDNVVPAYGAANLAVTVNGMTARRTGDGGRVLASYGATTDTTIEFTWSGDWDSLGVLLGVDIETYQTTPEQIRAFKFRPRVLPHFGLVGSFSTDDGQENAIHFFAPKCALTPESIAILTQGGTTEAEYATVTLTAQVLPDDNYFTDGENTVVHLSIGSPDAGTYKLQFGNQITAALAFGANAAAITAALELLPNIGDDNVIVTDGDPSGFDIEFIGDLAGGSYPPIVGVDDDETFNGTLATSRTTVGQAGENMTWRLFELEGAYEPALPPNFAVAAA